jgi:hypothetical protein
MKIVYVLQFKIYRWLYLRFNSLALTYYDLYWKALGKMDEETRDKIMKRR